MRHRTLSVVLPFVLGFAFLPAANAGTPGAEQGQRQFAVCAACHSTNGTNKIGPSLKGVFGRRSGSVIGFRYSHAMKRAHLIWNAKTLDAYIASPQTVVPGNRMPFSGIADTTERQAIISYLKGLK